MPLKHKANPPYIRAVSDEEFDRHVEIIKSHPIIDPVAELAKIGLEYMSTNPAFAAAVPFFAAATDFKPSREGVQTLVKALKL